MKDSRCTCRSPASQADYLAVASDRVRLSKLLPSLRAEPRLTIQINASRTAAQALEQIALWFDLPVQRRRNLATSVQTLCRVGSKRVPSTVRLDPMVCLPLLDGASADALGISEKTHRNCRAGIRAMLRRLEILAPVRVREAVSDPVWAGFIAALPALFHPHRLRAVMEFCETEGISPTVVTSQSLSDYLAYRIASRGGPNVRSDVAEVAR